MEVRCGGGVRGVTACEKVQFSCGGRNVSGKRCGFHVVVGICPRKSAGNYFLFLSPSPPPPTGRK